MAATVPPHPTIPVWLYLAHNYTMGRATWFLGSDAPGLRGIYVGVTESQGREALARWNEGRREDGHPLLALKEANLPRLDRSQTLREIARLSSGLVAVLCGSGDEEDVDAYLAAWCEWVAGQDADRSWVNWQDCHEDFVAHLEGVVLPTFGA